MDLKEEGAVLGKIEDHWYYRSKANAMRSYLRGISLKQILDIGAGSGFFSKHLLKKTTAQKAMCVDVNYQADRDEPFSSKGLLFRKQYTYMDADLVLLMDVLEHVDDDMGLLKEQISKTPAGTCFFITVPAFEFLWSEHDEYLEHKRRYTLRQLEGLVRGAGLSIERSSYYFGAIFPLVVAVRMFGKWMKPAGEKSKSDMKRHSTLVNSALSLICWLELPFLRFNRIAGLSVFCLARKDGAAPGGVGEKQ